MRLLILCVLALCATGCVGDRFPGWQERERAALARSTLARSILDGTVNIPPASEINSDIVYLVCFSGGKMIYSGHVKKWPSFSSGTIEAEEVPSGQAIYFYADCIVSEYPYKPNDDR
jgi:hypothetical protein